MSTKTNLALDLTMFTAFLAVSNPRLTGNTVHEWLGAAFAAAIVTHLLLHWNWVVQITRRFFQKLFHQSRLNYVINALFFVAMTATIFSGLLISKDVLATIGIQLGEVSRGWKSIHSLGADASLILLGVHVALHWKWIVSHMGRYLVAPVRGLFGRRAARPLVVQPVQIESGK